METSIYMSDLLLGSMVRILEHSGFQASTPFPVKAGTEQDCHLPYPTFTSCLYTDGLLTKYRVWYLFKKKKRERALINIFKIKEDDSGISWAHDAGTVSLVSLALDSWLFSMSHFTTSVKEREGTDTKRVCGAMLMSTGPKPHLYPMAPFRVMVTSCHTSVALKCAGSNFLP